MEIRVKQFQSVREIGHPIHRLPQFLQVVYLLNQFLARWQKLMNGRVQETYGHRVSVHDAEDLFEILSLEREKVIKCFLSFLLGFSQNHLLDNREPLGLIEHPLCSTKPDTLSPVFPCLGHAIGGVRIGHHPQFADVICPLQ